MSPLVGARAAELIRQAVSGRLAEREFDSVWPDVADAATDIVHSRRSVIALYEARRLGDGELSRLLEEDLSDAATALEEGQPLEWFEVTPRWSKMAHAFAFAIGVVGWGVSVAEGWPWWSRWAALVVALAVVWVAEWAWAAPVQGVDVAS